MLRFKGYSLLKDAIRMVGSGSLVQAISLLIMPWISMLYSPELLGVFALFSLTASIFSLVSGGRFEQAIVVAHDTQDAKRLTTIALLINLASALLIGLVAWIAHDILIGTRYQDIVPYLAWLPWVVALVGGYNTFSSLMVYRGKFDRLMTSKLTQGMGNNLGKILLAYPKATVLDLIWAFSLSHVAGIITLGWRRSPKENQEKFFSLESKIGWSDLWQTARKYQSFPLYSLPQALIDILLGSLLLAALPYGYGIREIGLLTMATTLSRRPIQLIADNMGLVYFNRFAERIRHHKPIRPLILRLLRLWIWIAIPTGIVLYAVMPFLVRIILDDEYLLCTPIIRAIIPLLLPNFLNCILNILPDSLRWQKRHLYVQVGLFVLEAILIVVLLYAQLPFVNFITYYYGAETLIQIGYTFWLISLTKTYEKQIAL